MLPPFPPPLQPSSNFFHYLCIMTPSLDKIKETLQAYFASKPILKAWIFGSFARGEQTPDSDIDILVDFDINNYPSLLTHSRFILELEEKLGYKIDLVPNDALYPLLRESVDKDKILIYERF